MKRFISREHADQLKRIYMKTDLEHSIIQHISNRKAALYEILAGREQLRKPGGTHENTARPYHCND
ncbi:MAG: hypothetical protein NC112_04950 [Oxalobacter formigenes]|nr:hypothetical protein [Oxalobacter formigenes]